MTRPRFPAKSYALARLLLISLIAVKCAAQQNMASLIGTVTDELGGLVPAATLSLTDEQGREQRTQTDAIGRYAFRNIAPGNYGVTVEAAGFLPGENEVNIQAGKSVSLDFTLTVTLEQQDVTVNEQGLGTEAERNADTIVLRGRDLETLPTDPQALSSILQAMAGGVQGPDAAQIQVDGFSNGRLPPKEAIREIRINNNPYSAANEFPGYGGIEIYTNPGTDKFRGSLGFDFTDESLGSRNPFAPTRAPYQNRNYNFNLSGPVIPKRASFSFYFNRYASDANSIVNATTLNPLTLIAESFNQTFLTPLVSHYGSARFDLKLNQKHNLVANYSFNDRTQDTQGIGGFALPSRAYRGLDRNHVLQITETAVVNEKVVNETRFQFVRNTSRQISESSEPALEVLESFSGGGAPVGSTLNQESHLELQNFTSWSHNKHFLKFGWRLRRDQITSIAPVNFFGTYTFAGGTAPVLDSNGQAINGPGGELLTSTISSLERYRRTLLLSRRGLTATEIRRLGGGATQFSIAGGSPGAEATQYDTGIYLQDEWKIRGDFSVSPGLRYENQTNINSDLNFAPRIGFAWSPTFFKRRPAEATLAKDPAKAPTNAQASGPPTTVIRGGFGAFYRRIDDSLVLQTARFNGINQQQFITSDPLALDLYPTVPSLATLAAFAQPQVRNVFDAQLSPSAMFRASLSIEQQLPRKMQLIINLMESRTRRMLRTVNVNAPLAGTYMPDVAISGVRPLGREAGNILQYQSNGRMTHRWLVVSLNGQVKRLRFWSNYTLGKRTSTDEGTSGSPFDPYDFSREWGRASYDVRHFLFAGGNLEGPWGLSLSPFLIAASGGAFNITTGKDINGDNVFAERPTYATDLTKPGVVNTPYGVLDPNPEPGQQLIPRNLGQGPGYLLLNLGINKSFSFGKAIAPAAATPGTASSTQSSVPPAKAPVQRPYQLQLSAFINNLLNNTNEGTPVGNMSSPFFLKSNSPQNFISFGPGGLGGNRQINLSLRLSF